VTLGGWIRANVEFSSPRGLSSCHPSVSLKGRHEKMPLLPRRHRRCSHPLSAPSKGHGRGPDDATLAPEQMVPHGDRGVTVNLHARDDFDEGDIGHVTGHRVRKATEPETQNGSNLVTALQDVKAGTNGWFEVR
jgi:hypothetical protein